MPDDRAATPEDPAGAVSARPGRTPATSHGELSHIALSLFLERGFDETTIDDIVHEAAIGRRTFFRYFSSKKELPWGDFEGLLERMRSRLAEIDGALPLVEALRRAVIEFNTFPPEEYPHHRSRMWLLLNVPSLTAYSTLKYASWREVIAQFVAQRRGEGSSDLAPQTIAWACLGLCLAAYERWLIDDDADLLELLDRAFETAASLFGTAAE